MGNWYVLVHEVEPKHLRKLVTQTYLAEDEQAAHELAEQVAFEYRPAVQRAGRLDGPGARRLPALARRVVQLPRDRRRVDG